jgi:hypothetical protein
MAHRAHRVVRHKPVEVEEVEDDEVDDVEEELDAEEEEVEVAKPARRAARKIEPEPEEEEEDEPAPVKAKPAAKIAVPVKAAAKKAAEPEEEEEDEEPAAKPAKVSIRKVDGMVAENVVTKILEAMDQGKSIVITKTDDNQWQFASAEKFKDPDKLRGKEYWDKVKNPEYEKWMDDWHNLTYAEKVAKAKKAGVKWEAHDNPKIDVIRLTAAMRAHLGIEKYKEEYMSRTARAALRG